jgi:hypothetical protein
MLMTAAPAPADTQGTLAVYPSAVRLDTRDDTQRVVVALTQPDGVTRDVTAQATYALSPENIATLTDAKHLTAASKGEAKLAISFDGLSCEAQVTVVETAKVRPISFRNDIEPVLMKAGCNSGTCHGGARGKNGFRLSLFGFDPKMDYINLTREMTARRLDVSDLPNSLMLLKGTAGAPHGGGKRFEVDDALYAVLGKWIGDGAPDDVGNLPKLTGIEIRPDACVLQGNGSAQQMSVRATYSDGTDRDVTHLAVFASNNDAAAAVSDGGMVTAKDRGEAFVMARFGTFAVVSQMIVLPAEVEFAWPDTVKPVNYVDELVHAKLRKMRIVPSEVCTDEVFIRRVFIDILGVLPTPAEFAQFMGDARPDKRALLIDTLLKRPEFPELWAMKWAEMLRIESGKLNTKGVQLYYAWLRDAVVNDMPIDQIVRELLGAEGGNYHNPPSNFYLIETSPTQMAENVAQVFAGIRIQCAQCHNHPFERWTQDDYYSFAAFFSQVGRKGSEDPREQIIYNSGGGEVTHITTGAVMKPKFLGGAIPEIKPGQDRRKVVAEWLTAPDNAWFAECFANRVWTHLMARGIIDPPDDVRVSNPPSHPELLARLGRKFVESKYDIRAVMRDICNSRTYQLATGAHATNAASLSEFRRRNFSHATIRRIPAEQLLDAVCQVTEVPEKFAGLPRGARATQVADARAGSYFLTTFGRPARQSACTCERRNEPTLAQALHLINGPTVSEKVKAKEGRLNRLLEAKAPLEQVVSELYVAALSRNPTDAEKAAAMDYIAKSKDPRGGLEDLFWAVLNSREFVFIH